MKKTIFYIKSKTDDGDFYFDGIPYNVWICLEDFLYEPSNASKYTVRKDTNFMKNVSLSKIQDCFSDEGIIRRIALYIDN